MAIAKYLSLLGVVSCLPCAASAAGEPRLGPLYDDFSLTLESGRRTEILGPLNYSEERETRHTWAIPPLTLAHTWDPATDSEEWDFAYPLLTYDRFGKEVHWQIMQLWNVAGGKNQDASEDRRFTLFPFYFQQRSTIPSHNYTAVVPFYGHLDHRLFRDETDFVLFPCYVKTRKGDVVTRNMPYPFFHLRRGDGLVGWQLWPLMGHEHKEPTSRTNSFGEVQIVGGHDKRFLLWPFYTQADTDLGTDHTNHLQTLLFVYSLERSEARTATSFGWPLGVTHTIDRTNGYTEWDAPFPIVEFARGPGKTTRRVWPFFSEAHNASVESDFYGWPVYKFNGYHTETYARERERILFFLYSDTREHDLGRHKDRVRVDCFPLYTRTKEFDGRVRFQALSILEPIFPNNKTLERDLSPLYAFWRAERNPKTRARSESLLWNLYRRDETPETKRCSLLFGLVQYQTGAPGPRWRIAYLPLGPKAAAPPVAALAPPAQP